MANGREEFIAFKNWLKVNPALGPVAQQGETEELLAFLKAMKPHHIDSFSGTFTIGALELPLPVFCTNDVNQCVQKKYWTPVPPSSPLQHSLENAMHPGIYSQRFSSEWNYPVNKGVVMHEIPRGAIVAYGKVAPLYGFLGGGQQIFYLGANQACSYTASWTEWLSYGKTPIAYTTNWEHIKVNGVSFYVENNAAKAVVNSQVPRIFKNPNQNAQTFLNIARSKASDKAFTYFAFDTNLIIKDTPAVTYHFADMKRIAVQTKNARGFYLESMHEVSHATLALAGPYAKTSPLYEPYAAKMREALLTDYWYYKTQSSLVKPAHIQKQIAKWLYYTPQTYPISERLNERIAYGIQSWFESEKAFKSVAPRFNHALEEYVKAELDLLKFNKWKMAGGIAVGLFSVGLNAWGLASAIEEEKIKNPTNVYYIPDGINLWSARMIGYSPLMLLGPYSFHFAVSASHPDARLMARKMVNAASQVEPTFRGAIEHIAYVEAAGAALQQAALQLVSKPAMDFLEDCSLKLAEKTKPLARVITNAIKKPSDPQKECIPGVYVLPGGTCVYIPPKNQPTSSNSVTLRETVPEASTSTKFAIPPINPIPPIEGIAYNYTACKLQGININNNVNVDLLPTISLPPRHYNFGDGLLVVPPYQPQPTKAAKAITNLEHILIITGSYGTEEIMVALKFSTATGLWVGLAFLIVLEIAFTIQSNKEERKFWARQRALNKVLAQCQTIDNEMQEVYDTNQAANEVYKDYMTSSNHASYLKAVEIHETSIEKMKNLSIYYQNQIEKGSNVSKRTRDYLRDNVITNLNENLKILENNLAALKEEKEIVDKIRDALNKNALLFNINEINDLLNHYERLYPKRLAEINELKKVTKLAEENHQQPLSYWQEENKKLNLAIKLEQPSISNPTEIINTLKMLEILCWVGYSFYDKCNNGIVSTKDAKELIEDKCEVEIRIPDTGIKLWITPKTPLNKVFFNALFRSSTNCDIKLYAYADGERKNQLSSKTELRNDLDQGGFVQVCTLWNKMKQCFESNFCFNKDSIFIESNPISLSLEKSQHDVEYVKLFQIMFIINRQQEIANELTRLGYIKEASRVYKSLIENNPESELKNKWEKAYSHLVYTFNNQSINMLFSPCKDILVRHLRGYENNKTAKLANQSLAILSRIESMLPFTLSSLMLQSLTELWKGNFVNYYKNYIKISFSKLMEDKWQLGLSGTRMSLQLLQFPFEAYLNISKDMQEKIKSYRENTCYYGSKILEIHSLYNTINRLIQTGGKSADSPRLILTLVESLLHYCIFIYDLKNQKQGSANTSSLYYRGLHTLDVALRSLGDYIYWRNVDNIEPNELIHGTHLLLSSVNVAHSYLATSSLSEAKQKVLENCMANIIYYEKLHDNLAKKGNGDQYLIFIDKNLNKMNAILVKYFGGLNYQDHQTMLVNKSRLFYLYRQVKDCYVKGDYNEGISLIAKQANLLDANIDASIINGIKKLEEALIKLKDDDIKVAYQKAYYEKNYPEIISILKKRSDIFHALSSNEKVELIIIFDAILKNEQEKIKHDCLELFYKLFPINTQNIKCNKKEKGKEVVEDEGYLNKIIKGIRKLVKAELEISDQLFDSVVKNPHQADYLVQGLKILSRYTIASLSQETIIKLLLASGNNTKKVAEALIKLNKTYWHIPYLSPSPSEFEFVVAFYRQAIVNNDATIVKACLKMGTWVACNGQFKSEAGQFHTPLTLAASLGHLDVAHVLITSGARVNEKHPKKNSLNALTYAVQRNDIKMVAMLLEAKANPNDLSGINVFENSSPSWERDKIIRLLMDHGAHSLRKHLTTSNQVDERRSILRLFRSAFHKTDNLSTSTAESIQHGM